MKLIITRLNRIRNVWSDYIWKYKYCQKKVNFTEETKTNYIGDLLFYLEDTLNIISKIKPARNFQSGIFQIIGILQIIYAQQDLIDELLYIYKLPQSNANDKKPNRDIRNELIGHPIRRTSANELISTIFFDRIFTPGMIHYHLYAKEFDFKSKEIKYPYKVAIENHKRFLEKYTNILWVKNEKILTCLKNQLKGLSSIINKDIDFLALIKVVEHRYAKFSESNYLFEKDILINCYSRRNEHPRYKNVIALYKYELKFSVPEAIYHINHLLEISPNDLNTIPEIQKNYTEDISYEFSKLFTPHDIYDTNYFKKKFKSEEDIITELDNMSFYGSYNKLEYYSSYELLKVLFMEKNIKT